MIDEEDYELVSRFKWRFNSSEGYAMSHRRVSGRYKTIYMHSLINNTPPGLATDHIDRDKLNNRRSNLRTTTYSVNALNSPVRSTSSSGFKGVYRERQKWRAVLICHGKREHLGVFTDPAEASRVYEERLAQVLPI